MVQYPLVGEIVNVAISKSNYYYQSIKFFKSLNLNIANYVLNKIKFLKAV